MGTMEFKHICFPKKEYLANEVAKIVADEFGIKLDENKTGPGRTKTVKVWAESAESFVDTIRRALNKKVEEYEKLDIYKNQVLRRKESERKTYYANFIIEQVINEDLYGWLCSRIDDFDTKKKYYMLREEKGERLEDWGPREYRTEFQEEGEVQDLELSPEQYGVFMRRKTDIVIDFVYNKYIKDRPMPDISVSDVKCCLSCIPHTANTTATISCEAKEALAVQGITFVPLEEERQVAQVNSQQIISADIDAAIELALRQKKLELVIDFVCKNWIEIDEKLLKHDIGYSETADSNPGPKHIYKDVLERGKDLSRYYKIRKKS